MDLRSNWCASPSVPTAQSPDPGRGAAELGRETGEYPKVVAHFLDGHLLKGFALGFRLSRRDFLLRSRGAKELEAAIPVRVTGLKALFFVKEFDGDPAYRELRDTARPSLLGQRVRVRFRDGEALRGTTPSFELGGAGFFLVPLDPRSNNRRIYVVATNAAQCCFENRDGP